MCRKEAVFLANGCAAWFPRIPDDSDMMMAQVTTLVDSHNSNGRRSSTITWYVCSGLLTGVSFDD